MQNSQRMTAVIIDTLNRVSYVSFQVPRRLNISTKLIWCNTGKGTVIALSIVVLVSIILLLVINNPSLFFLIEFAVGVVLGQSFF